jgi:hypothetical protein
VNGHLSPIVTSGANALHQLPLFQSVEQAHRAVMTDEEVRCQTAYCRSITLIEGFDGQQHLVLVYHGRRLVCFLRKPCLLIVSYRQGPSFSVAFGVYVTRGGFLLWQFATHRRTARRSLIQRGRPSHATVIGMHALQNMISSGDWAGRAILVGDRPSDGS